MEAELVKRQGVPYTAIPAAGVHGVGLRSLPGNIAKLVRGVAASRRILRQFKPDVLLFTGGYVAAPMAVAGRSIPSLLYTPDIEPGMALKFLARYASIVAVTAPDSRAFFPGRKHLEVSGYPTRPELTRYDRDEARRSLNLNLDQPVVLVTGGSKGARSINRAVTANLNDLLKMAQVLHLTGNLDWPEIQAFQAGLSPELAGRYHAYSYLHDMGSALASADIVVSRAGASTLGEYPLFGLPAVLVPYPYAWRYQKVNAAYLVDKGAAKMIKDEDLPKQLVPVLSELLDDVENLNAMRAAMRSLARPEASQRLAALVRDLAGANPQEGNA
ncbi:UDP-N-acetylglucosamine-N-acetylmuramylpentapeptide N-acetylglucosamine transferase [Longilinea arvoryzae]|uniref:UDP-N-acetylglucosamine-N-acetylmuramylpentapeptide N-acetylglucosamine transferase n=2 Tax=Longilinea arvoryzae TaxID=360412 RepID=A0A0S7BKD7_9CHLR|nr:UDP-N-acetylglucosamine-N-acetylmuramylpentapeptide N-acetylglucosamine transferase [Longilinea arvoryzae]